MGGNRFQFKQFNITQDRCAMKVTTDACLFGAWTASQTKESKCIIDIGAGTGLLSLMLAQANHAEIHAVEIEKDCFEQMNQNIGESVFSERIYTHPVDIKTFEPGIHFDTIICNPPFHQDQLKSEQKNINLARHESGLTLEDLFRSINKLIDKNGSVYLLLPFYRKNECKAVAKENGWEIIRMVEVRHSPKHEPFRVMFQFSGENSTQAEEEMIIHNEDGTYTDSFIQLLSPYYLYL